MSDIPTPRTDKAAYYMGRTGSNRDGERWCDLLNESRAIEKDLAEARKVLQHQNEALRAVWAAWTQGANLNYAAERVKRCLMDMEAWEKESCGSLKPSSLGQSSSQE